MLALFYPPYANREKPHASGVFPLEKFEVRQNIIKVKYAHAKRAGCFDKLSMTKRRKR